MRSIRVLWVPVEGDAEMRDVVVDVEPFQEQVGGYFARTLGSSYIGRQWSVYYDEDAGPKNVPANLRATRLAQDQGWHHPYPLLGPVFFAGGIDGDGADQDVTRPLLTDAWRLGVIAAEFYAHELMGNEWVVSDKKGVTLQRGFRNEMLAWGWIAAQ